MVAIDNIDYNNKMKKLTPHQYLTSQSKSLAPLLTKLNQLNQWNQWLKENLTDEPLTRHCYIVNLDKTALIVIADSAHWSTRLKFHIPELLKKLRRYSGLENVRAICCKVQPSHHASVKKKSRHVKTLSDKAAQMVCHNAQKISDEKLKKILEKIASYRKHDFELQE
jgi:hypothetical protein